MVELGEAEVLLAVLHLFPDAELGCDSDGQLVINTNCMWAGKGGESILGNIALERPRTRISPMQLEAALIELTDEISDEESGFQKIDGWFMDGNGRVNIQYGGQWHRYRASDKVWVRRLQLNVRRFLDLSIEHLPYTHKSFVNHDGMIDESGMEHMNDCATYSNDYGWACYVPEMDDEDIRQHMLRMSGEDFVRIFEYAESLGCDYIFFDSDAPIDPHLPVFPYTRGER